MRKKLALLVLALLVIGLVHAKSTGPPAHAPAHGQRNLGPVQAFVVYDANDPHKVIGSQTFQGGINLTPAMRDDIYAEIMKTFGDSSEELFFDGKPFFDANTVAMLQSRPELAGDVWVTIRQSCAPGCKKGDWRCCILVGCSGAANNCVLRPGRPTPIV